MDKFITNPFDRSALTDSKLLAGRENEYKQIKFILRNAHNQSNRIKSIMICGDRGVGKTSMLNLIEDECSINNIIPIRVNLTESNSKNSNEFFWYLFSQTLSTIFALDLLGGRGGVIDSAIQKIIIGDGVRDVANWIFKTPILRKNYLNNENVTFEFDQLVGDLKLLRSEIAKINSDKYNQKTKFIFLVDESQNIYANKKIIEELRFIVQNQELGYAFVFAGDSSYEKSQWDIVFGGSHRDFEIINLDYFDDVNSVKEYFRKSLESIGWSSKEIEESLFYRFNRACSQIFNLTSGKPAWINEIAQKMFDRCMRKESDILRFDRNAQNDVKVILLNSGHIDNRKLEFVESLSPKHQKWLSKIFASELSTLRQVYFYSKFVLLGDNYFSPEDFQHFCQSLVDSGILVLLQKPEGRNKIGFDSNKQTVNLLDIPYYTFGDDADSFKLWLQINSDGGFLFSLAPPDFSFVRSITNDLLSETGNTFVINSKFQEINLEDEIRLSKIIEKINQGTYDVVEAPFRIIEMLYRFAKRIANSRNKQILFIKLIDNISKRVKVWNIYSINEHDRLIDFNENRHKIQRYREAVEKFNSNEINYTLEIFVDSLTEISIEKFQNLIINSGDSKKRGLVISDKMELLVKEYMEHNLENSYKIASFFYNLYEDGHELGIHNLNNTAYVFMVKNELERAYQLLKQAKKIILTERMEKDDHSTAALVIYNLGILNVKMSHFLEAKIEFENCLEYYNNYDFDENTGALLVLEILGAELHINELTEDNGRGKMKCKEQSLNNIAVLEQVIRKSSDQVI